MYHSLINVDGFGLSRLWHCFGTPRRSASMEEILGMYDASGSNVLPINTHRLSRELGYAGLELGFAGVSLTHFQARRDADNYFWMLNINHQRSAEAVIEKTRLAVDLTKKALVKLEVLTDNLLSSKDSEVLRAVEFLVRQEPQLHIFPLISANLDIAKELVNVGCHLLRVMGSPIGSGRGIEDEEVFAQICTLGVPVILDGGVGSEQDARRAFALGAEGVLVNSMLFSADVGPVARMRCFVKALDQILAAETTDGSKRS